jgi:hypothetical protein
VNEESVLTRAREMAYASQGPVAGASHLELAALRRALSTTRREVHRVAWRRAVQHRSTLISRVLRVALRALRAPGGRERDEQGWLFNVGTGDAETIPSFRVITRTPTHSLHDLARPIPVIVVRPELVDLDVLHTLGEAIALAVAEVT